MPVPNCNNLEEIVILVLYIKYSPVNYIIV